MDRIRIYLSENGIDYTPFFPNTTKELSSICVKGTYQIPKGWSYGANHKVNTFKVTLAGDPYYINAFESFSHIKVEKNGVVVFLGMAPTFEKKIDKSDYFEVTATFSDYSKSFADARFNSDENWERTIVTADGWKVCDPEDTENSLLHYLFERLDPSGLFTLHCDYTDTTPVSHMHIKGKDKVQEVLRKFLTQNSLAYYVVNKDIYVLDVLEEIEGTAVTIPNIESGATISEKPYIERKVPYVRRPVLITDAGKKTVYDSGEVSVGSEASGNNNYPTANTYVPAECAYKDIGDNQEIASYRDVTFDFWTQGNINPDLIIEGRGQQGEGSASGSVNGTSFNYRVNNDNWLLNRKFRLTFKAYVDILDYSNVTKPHDETIWNGSEERCAYVYSEQNAQRYMRALLYQKDMEARVYSFYSDLDLELNSVVVIQNVTTAQEIEAHKYIRITDKIDNLDDFGGYTYKGVVYQSESISVDDQFQPTTYTAPNKDFDFTASRTSVIGNAQGAPIVGQSVVFGITLKEYLAEPTLTVNGIQQTLVRQTSEENASIDGKTFTCIYTTPANMGVVGAFYAHAELDGEVRTIIIDVIPNGIVETSYQYYISTSRDELTGGRWLDELPATYTGYVWRRTKSVYADETEAYGEALYFLTADDVDIASFTLTTEYGLSEDTETAPDTFYESIADTWRKGLFVWSRDIKNYETGTTDIGQPYYNEELTQQLLMACRFTATPSSSTWNKNMRHEEPVTIALTLNIVGYGDAIPIVSTIPANVSRTTSGNIVTLGFSSTIADEISVSISLDEYPAETPVTLKLKAVDTTNKGMHFPPSSAPRTGTTYVEGGVTYSYVKGDYYLLRTTETIEGVTYNTSLNAMYFDGSTWVDLFTIQNKDSEQMFAISQIIPDVFQYPNSENISIADYYFLRNLIAQNLTTEMLYSIYIQVGTAIYGGAFQPDGSNPTGGQGFHLDRNGVLQAFNAILTNAKVSGTLNTATLQTQIEQQRGSEYILAPLSDESWSGNEALSAVKTALIADNVGDNGCNEIVSITCAYPAQENIYNYAMLIESPNVIKNSGNIASGSSFVLPIKAPVVITGGQLYDANGNLFTGGTLEKGAVLTNRERWNISELYNNSGIPENTLFDSGLVWNNSNYGFVRLTNLDAVAVPRHYRTFSFRDTVTNTFTFTVPDYFHNASLTIQAPYGTEGSLTIKRNGQTVFDRSWRYPNIAPPAYITNDVEAGEIFTITIKILTLSDYYYLLTATVSAQTFRNLGLNSVGFYTYVKNNGLLSFTNKGVSTEYEQQTNMVSLSSPIQWTSADYLLGASLQYDYSLYSIGLNLLDSNGIPQQTVENRFYNTSQHFYAEYKGAVIFRDTTAPHYFHYNGIEEYEACEVPLSAFETGITYYENISNAYVITSDVMPNASKQYFIKNSILEDSILNIFSSSLVFQKKDEPRVPEQGAVQTVNKVVWTRDFISIASNGNTYSVTKADWLSVFELSFVAIARDVGNYAESIFPMQKNEERTHIIRLGRDDACFDEAHIIEVNSEQVNTDELYLNGKKVGVISDAFINALT